MKEQKTEIKGLPYWKTTSTFEGRVEYTFGKKLPRLENGLILDIGCSSGGTTNELHNLYPLCITFGIDIDYEKIKKASDKNKNSIFLVADGYNAPFPDKTFDAVFCMNNIAFALDLEDEKQCRKIVPRIARLVKPEGYLLFSKVESYVTLRRENERFRLIDYKNIYSDISQLAAISKNLSGQRPEIVPRKNSGKYCSGNLLNIFDYKENAASLPDYLKISREKIFSKNNRSQNDA